MYRLVCDFSLRYLKLCIATAEQHCKKYDYDPFHASLLFCEKRNFGYLFVRPHMQ